MDSPSKQNNPEHHRNPLVPMGIIVMGILILPMLFYSTGPEGPVKEGDVVFATGKHRVSIINTQSERVDRGSGLLHSGIKRAVGDYEKACESSRGNFISKITWEDEERGSVLSSRRPGHSEAPPGDTESGYMGWNP